MDGVKLATFDEEEGGLCVSRGGDLEIGVGWTLEVAGRRGVHGCRG
jgi:hypothetical protein